jgi:hypothetical protein
MMDQKIEILQGDYAAYIARALATEGGHLARNAEAVCRHYLSNGRRAGRYWLVGDVHNTPGRSMFVRLHGAEAGASGAGKWTDAASGQRGDLLDIIRETCGYTEFHEVAEEARRFLGFAWQWRPFRHGARRARRRRGN